MRVSTITKALGLAALLGSPASMAATITITASTLAPVVGSNFTMTITSDAQNTFSATMLMAFDASKVAFVSGAPLLPWTVFTKNTAVTANPAVFDMEAPSAVNLGGAVYDVAVLTFTALAAGAAGIVINDDGGTQSGWAASGGGVIQTNYTQANVVISAVPAPATVGLLATGLAGLMIRSVRRKRAVA